MKNLTGVAVSTQCDIQTDRQNYSSTYCTSIEWTLRGKMQQKLLTSIIWLKKSRNNDVMIKNSSNQTCSLTTNTVLLC